MKTNLDLRNLEISPNHPRIGKTLQMILKEEWELDLIQHPGQIHFEMEQSVRPSRWNTLRALRVLKHFNKL
jgi:hypothetical protein